MCVNFITIVNRVSEKKRGDIFCTDFRVYENFDNPSYNGGREMILIRPVGKIVTHFDTLDMFLHVSCKLSLKIT